MPVEVRLFFCRVSGCLTEGRIFVSASGEEMVSINTRDTMGIRMLKDENVEVRNTKFPFSLSNGLIMAGCLGISHTQEDVFCAVMFCYTCTYSFFFYIGVWE